MAAVTGVRVLGPATLLLALVLSSCSTGSGGPSVNPVLELRSRPSYEQVVVTYLEMEQQIRDAITAVAPTVGWRFEQKAGTSGCGEPFSNLGARHGSLDSWGAPGGIPDPVWAAALRAAGEVAARYGFTDSAVLVDQPRRHEARFLNPSDGAVTSLGTGVNAVLATSTGCNWPAELLRGSTSPTPTR